ncbi:MAG: SUMF1/EgtB/PvdO family nonheme iron enzyme [Pseudomonadota bacterium]
MADVFISYKREEKQLAQRLHDALEQFGFSVWFDVELLSGDEFRPVIVEMIDKCKAVVVLWSPLSIQSQFVIDEASYAQRQDKLCPTLLAPCDIPFGFGGVHADSLEGWSGQLRHDGFNRLLGSIEQRTGQEARLGTSTHETARQRAEITAFQAAAKLRSIGAWNTFLEDYPGTSFRRFIESQMNDLKQRSQDSSAPLPTGSRPPIEPVSDGSNTRFLVGGGVAAIAAFSAFFWIDPFDLAPDMEPQAPEPVVEAVITPPLEPVEELADTSGLSEPYPAAVDDAAWGSAQERATVSAYRDYLADDANTRHRGRAETALQRHEQAMLRLQTALNAKGFEAGTEDGQVGRQTRAAVEAYRRARGFDVASVDIAAIDPAPIQDFAESVERWVRLAGVVDLGDGMIERSDNNQNELEGIIITGNTRTGLAISPSFSPGAALRDCAECPEMAVIPPGAFTMGGGPWGDSYPIREVQISYDFAISKYEITRAQFEEFIVQTDYRPTDQCVLDGYVNPQDGFRFDNLGFEQGDGHPVVCVTWNDALAYVDWLSEKTGFSYRLPSEAEWEYSARAGTDTDYFFGNDVNDICEYANGDDSPSPPRYTFRNLVCDDGFEATAPVGSYAPNKFGLFDILGNAAEWTADCYRSSYSTAASTDGAVWETPNCRWRSIRGGAYTDPEVGLGVATRKKAGVQDAYNYVGFRVARAL